jgi:hypothetical protein
MTADTTEHLWKTPGFDIPIADVAGVHAHAASGECVSHAALLS